MKKVFFAVSAIATISFAFTTFSEVLPIGASIPKADLKLKDISGKEVSLKDAKKKNGLLVMFSCNTCPWVVKNQSRTREIANYALSKEIGVILLNSNEGQRDDADSFSEMKAYATNQGYKWYYAVDANNVLADEFGANRTPEVFLFNGDGKHVYHGAIDDNPGDASNVQRKHLKEAIDEIVSGKDVSVKESRSMGCQIKRKG
ncbi:MAG TPA: thioredoxin family protein [Chitinophagaceae bacterium]|nr:thioredoxin family protein [Chitinophagaceae bacterium]